MEIIIKNLESKIKSKIKAKTGMEYDYQKNPISKYSIVSDTKKIFDIYGCFNGEIKTICDNYTDEEVFNDETKLKEFVLSLNLRKS